MSQRRDTALGLGDWLLLTGATGPLAVLTAGLAVAPARRRARDRRT